ncbi:MAG: NAD(P)H-binding protein [Candidatus Nitrosotenuis sp.]
MRQTELKIAVCGASGFVGTNLRKLLHSKKIHVVSLARKKHRRFESEKSVIFSDLANKNLPKKLSGCNALVHLIGSGAQTADSDYQLVNVDQTTKIIRLCKKSKIKKIVYISGLGVSNSTTMGYFISKLKAEQQIIKSGLDYTIFRASHIIGQNDPLTKNLLRQAKRGYLTIPGSGSYVLQPISIDDVSKIILLCINNKKFSNQIIDLVGPKTISFEKHVRQFARGKKIKIRKLPLETAYSAAIRSPKKAIYGLDDLNILLGSFTSSHKKLERLCGFRLKAGGLSE